MPFFKNVFRSRDGSRSASKAGKHADQTNGGPVAHTKPRWEDAWSRKEVAPEEIQQLIHVCTQEMKSRALDMPFLLLPFRPNSDTSTAKIFIRSFFRDAYEGTGHYTGAGLEQELRLTEPLVLCSIMKWCWSRLPGGVVTWDAYELFRIGESDSNFARHAFDTFIPLSVDSDARKIIIADFFDLLAAIAARGKTNGMGGRKLSRMAGWWAFEHSDDGKGFDGGYKSWEKGADAASHLFFAYLRSLSPDSASSIGGITALPRSLQALVSQTEYPPQAPLLMQTTTTKVVMIANSVSPTPFALLRRAKHFEYRDDDEGLQNFSAYDDPVKALTDECRRVLTSISSANQSTVASNGTQDPSWSRFEDFGFSGLLDSPATATSNGHAATSPTTDFSSMRSGPRSRNTDFGRPTTPSWADFLSSGFADENGQTSPSPLLLPPDKVLPPIGEGARVQSSQSHLRGLQTDDLEPGELASITQFELDDTFWWVWMTSLAGEEPTERKAVFGRCALIEVRLPGAKWLVMEEQVKGATDGPPEGAYIAEKKGRFSFRTRLGRRKSTGKKPAATPQEPYGRTNANTPMSKSSIGPDQHARIQAAAARLAQQQQEKHQAEQIAQRRARKDDSYSVKTNSVMTLQPGLMSEASLAIKWDRKNGEGAEKASKAKADRDALRAKYLGDVNAGRGSRDNLLTVANGTSSPLPREPSERDLPALPSKDDAPVTRKQVPPAPLPVTPTIEKAQKAEASSAAKVPLPAASPMLPANLDEKPSERGDLDEHPALRNRVASPELDEIPAAVEEPVVKKSPPKKLKKKEGGGGFKKLFGKKKEKAPAVDRSQATATPSTLQAPETARLSEIQRDMSPVPPAPASSHSADYPDPIMSRSPELEQSAAVTAFHDNHHGATNGDQNAQREFQRFDQGPMDDMPAFIPDDSDDEPRPESVADVHEEHPAVPSKDSITPVQEPIATMDDVSEQSVDLTRQASPSQDRWAQIRKNAAERAARLSEEQSRRSQSQSARTDEGETSGEETIESRVARIKARVAELTGNADGPGGAPAYGRR